MNIRFASDLRVESLGRWRSNVQQWCDTPMMAEELPRVERIEQAGLF